MAGMSVDRKEQGATRQSILLLLRRHSEMTALELSDALGVGAVGVRQHLALLERDGLVHIAGVRRSVGRPSHLYALTPEAEQRFPRRYDRLALDLITYAGMVAGPDGVEQILSLRRAELARELAPALAGQGLAERVAALSAILAEQGYMCEWAQEPDGSFVLTEYNCPVDCVARRYPQLCAQEILLYEELLGAPVARESTIADGDRCCRYRIPG
jgi:predicted ArsR family transcriptional regulator